MAHAAVREEATEATIAAIAQKTMYSGGTVAFLGGVSANSIAAIGGLIVGIIGLVVTVYYKRKEDQRRTQQHEQFLASMKLPPGADE